MAATAFGCPETIGTGRAESTVGADGVDAQVAILKPSRPRTRLWLGCAICWWLVGAGLIIAVLVFGLYHTARKAGFGMWDLMFYNSGESAGDPFCEKLPLWGTSTCEGDKVDALEATNELACEEGMTMNYLYIFNFTNPEAYIQGAKPVVQELPPLAYCHLRKHVKVDRARLTRDGILRMRSRTVALAIGAQPLSWDDVLVLPNMYFAGVVSHGDEASWARRAGLTTSPTSSIFPMFVTATVAEVVGWKGAHKALPEFAANFSFNLMSDTDTSDPDWGWGEVNRHYPTDEPVRVHEAADIVVGFATVHSVGKHQATYLCTHDPDCAAQMIDRSNPANCTRGGFCEPQNITGYMGDVLPTGNFFSVLPDMFVPITYDWRTLARPPTRFTSWSPEAGRTVHMVNMEGEEVKGMACFRYTASAWTRRLESCQAGQVGGACLEPFNPLNRTAMAAFVSCAQAACQDGPDWLVKEVTLGGLDTCAALRSYLAQRGMGCSTDFAELSPLLPGYTLASICPAQCISTCAPRCRAPNSTDPSTVASYLACLAAHCEDSSPAFLALTLGGLSNCTSANATLAGLGCSSELSTVGLGQGIEVRQLCPGTCSACTAQARPPREPREPSSDSPGYDCDAPNRTFFVGYLVDSAYPPSLYMSSPWFHLTPYEASYPYTAAPNVPKWQPRDRVVLLGCQGCPPEAGRTLEFTTSINALTTMGYVVKFNTALQYNVRLVYKHASLLYPHALECMVPVVWVRSYMAVSQTRADMLWDYTKAMNLALPLFILAVVIGTMIMMLACLCAWRSGIWSSPK